LAERALILNATYEPLSIVSARRAMVLVLRSKAVAVASSHDVWKSIDQEFEHGVLAHGGRALRGGETIAFHEAAENEDLFFERQLIHTIYYMTFMLSCQV